MTGEGRPALAAARGRVKALLETVRQLEEERGAALLRVADLEARVVELESVETATAVAPLATDLDVARALVDVVPRHPKRLLTTRAFAVCLALTDGAKTVGALRDALGLSQASTSEWVRDAVEKGLVEQLGSEVDRRQHLFQLAPKGWVAMKDRAPRGRAPR